jgi:hypothetical protein
MEIQREMNVVVKNTSSYPVHLIQKGDTAASLTLSPKTQKDAIVKEGDVFYAILPDRTKVNVGVVSLLRMASDVQGMNHVGHVVDATLQKGCKGILKVGTPVQYRDDLIYSQKTTLRSYTGGVPWVDLINMTSVSLTFFDGRISPAPSFTVPPGGTYRYKGRHHFGTNYGTWLTNQEGIFEPAQILSPITHLLYGVF